MSLKVPLRNDCLPKLQTPAATFLEMDVSQSCPPTCKSFSMDDTKSQFSRLSRLAPDIIPCYATRILERMPLAVRLRGAVGRFPVASKSVLSIFDQALVSGTSFVTAAIIGRLTSPDELGLYYLVLSIVMLISLFQEQVIAGPYMVLSSRFHGESLAEYSGSYWMHHLVLTSLSIAGLILVFAACYLTGRTRIVPGLWALLGAGPLLVLRDGIRRFTFAHLQVKLVIALDAAVALVQLGGLLLLGLYGKLSLLGIFGVMALACLLACLGWYLFNPSHARFESRRYLPDWHQNWAFGKWAVLSFAVGGTSSYIMLWSLGLIYEPSTVAMFGACTTLVGVTNVILLGVANIFTPLAANAYSKGGSNELQYILTRTAAFLTIFVGAFCLFVFVTGDWLVVSVFGPYYRGTGAILFTLALGALMNGLIIVIGNGLWAVGQPRSVFIADVFGMCLTLVTAMLFIPIFGALGAAMAILCGSSAAAVSRALALARFFDGAAIGNGVAESVYAPESTCQ